MQRWFTRTLTLSLTLGLTSIFACSAALAQYTGAILVSNLAGKAQHNDPLLVNPWGLAYGPTTPFWVSDNGTGWATLYNGSGNKQTSR
jgi:hypothetical protein